MTTSQNKRILAHLKTGRTITGKQAMLEMGVMHLPRRILDLKEAGHNITDVWETNRNGKRYKRWSIINNGE